MKIKELISILEKLPCNDEIKICVEIDDNISQCEAISPILYNGIWYNPQDKLWYIGGKGELE